MTVSEGRTNEAAGARGREIGVGVLGTGFMAEHSSAIQCLRTRTPSGQLTPRLVATAAGRGGLERARSLEHRFDFEFSAEHWSQLIEEDRIEIFDNAATNDLHFAPTLAAIDAGKHVFCEKPLARNTDEAYTIWSAAEVAGIVHMCGFNYRFLPAIRLAKDCLRAGRIGEIYHPRARFLSSWAIAASSPRVWRLVGAQAGLGALGDIGSHIIDFARYLIGEISAVSATTRTFVTEREGQVVDVDDAASAVLEFECGAIGTLEASRMCAGHRNSLIIEVNGSQESLLYDMNDLNTLQCIDITEEDWPLLEGFRHIRVTDGDHPFGDLRWSYGTDIGWGDTFTFELVHLLRAIDGHIGVGPDAATFEDGYRAAEVCDAIARAARSARRETVPARPAPSGSPQPRDQSRR